MITIKCADESQMLFFLVIAILKCAGEGAEKCEVLVSPDKSRVTIEHKIISTKSAK